MISISPETYSGIALSLTRAIGETDFFNGRIEFDGPQGYATMTCTLVVYRAAGRVEKAVPVWWDFTLFTGGAIRATDFGWSGIVPYLY